MFNTHTYHGADGVLTVSDAADFDAETLTGYFDEAGVVGRLTNVVFRVDTEIKPFYEIGSRSPKELRAGNISIGGTVERAYINGALLKLLLGRYVADPEPETGTFPAPTFAMTVTLDNLQPEGEEGNNVVKAIGVKFNSWQTHLPEDDFVLEKLSFKALRITVEDKQISS